MRKQKQAKVRTYGSDPPLLVDVKRTFTWNGITIIIHRAVINNQISNKYYTASEMKTGGKIISYFTTIKEAVSSATLKLEQIGIDKVKSAIECFTKEYGIINEAFKDSLKDSLI